MCVHINATQRFYYRMDWKRRKPDWRGLGHEDSSELHMTKLIAFMFTTRATVPNTRCSVSVSENIGRCSRHIPSVLYR